MKYQWAKNNNNRLKQQCAYGVQCSGITRVDDTRGGNWGCHPSIFPEKPGDLFSHHCHYHYRFLLLSLVCHPSRVSPHTFFTCPTSFLHYSVVNLPTNFFPSGVTPWRVSPGAVRPPQWRHWSSGAQSSSSSLLCVQSLLSSLTRPVHQSTPMIVYSAATSGHAISNDSWGGTFIF